MTDQLAMLLCRRESQLVQRILHLYVASCTISGTNFLTLQTVLRVLSCCIGWLLFKRSREHVCLYTHRDLA